MAKDKRSRRDTLKEFMTGNIDKRIAEIERRMGDRGQENIFDTNVIGILRDQRRDILEMCKQQDETYNKKKPDGKEAK